MQRNGGREKDCEVYIGWIQSSLLALQLCVIVSSTSTPTIENVRKRRDIINVPVENKHAMLAVPGAKICNPGFIQGGKANRTL